MFANVEMSKEAADKDPNQMSDEEILRLLEARPLIMQMLEGAEQEAERRFQSGHKIPGLKMVHGRGSKNWALEQEEMATALSRMGIPKASIWQTKLVSPSQVTKLTWEKRDGSKKQLSKRQLERLEQEYIKKTPGKLKVVLESDPGQEVVMDAETIFKDVKPIEPALPAWLQ